MYISRVVVRNFRNFAQLDVGLGPGATCVIGENNTGKSNFLHALRLVVDSNLSSQYRRLIEQDIHSGIKTSNPEQVVIAVEFTDYTDSENECGLVGCWEVIENLSRLSYRFRPKRALREAIEAEEHPGTGLTLEDYEYELTGGGENDPATVAWNENLGESIRWGDLQHFRVAFLPALRDVQQTLRQSRYSPLGQLFKSEDVPQAERDELVKIVREANQEVANRPTIKNIGEGIQAAFSETAGEAFQMAVRLGMADPSFDSISRSLTVLLSNDALTDFEPSRNGLGLNNILYISMLIQYFERRVADPNTAGQLLLIEEPEAHLHPQLQRVLYRDLAKKEFQTILTTHSTHISSQASIGSLVVLTNSGEPATASVVPGKDTGLTDPEAADLERYLDATRSALLFARKVILVEGPAELFLIPALVRQVMEIDLDRLGISVIPIYGVHFGVYAKLFNEGSLPKKCAIIADGDLRPSDATEGEGGDDLPVPPDVDELANDYVHVFRCSTTFERALTMRETLRFLAKTAQECGARRAARELREGYEALNDGLEGDDATNLMKGLRQTVLNTACRFGKARFAQIASKHVNLATSIPKYIRNAINWLIEE